LYYFLDRVFEDTIDYSGYILKCSYRYYYTEDRIIRILIDYINAYGSLHHIYSRKPQLMLAIGRLGKLPKYIDILVNQEGYSRDLLRMYQSGYWEDEKTVYRKAKQILDNCGTFNAFLWREEGYPETPLVKYGVNRIKEKIGVKKECIGRDGQHYRSYREVVISNILWTCGYKYDKDYKFDRENSNESCDLYLSQKLNKSLKKDAVIEIWGYPDIRKDYFERKKNKLVKYNVMDIDLVQIPFELFNSYNSAKNIIDFFVNEWTEIDSSIRTKKLDYESVFFKNKDDYDKQIDYIKKELAPLLYDGIYMPSEEELKSLKKYSLIIKLKRLGGFKEAAKELKFKPKSIMKRPKQLVKVFNPSEYVDDLIFVIWESQFNYFPRFETLKGLNKTLYYRIRVVSHYLEVVDLAKRKCGLASYIEIEEHEKYISHSSQKEEVLMNLKTLSECNVGRIKKKTIIDYYGNRGYNMLIRHFDSIDNALVLMNSIEG